MSRRHQTDAPAEVMGAETPSRTNDPPCQGQAPRETTPLGDIGLDHGQCFMADRPVKLILAIKVFTRRQGNRASPGKLFPDPAAMVG